MSKIKIVTTRMPIISELDFAISLADCARGSVVTWYLDVCVFDVGRIRPLRYWRSGIGLLQGR